MTCARPVLWGLLLAGALAAAAPPARADSELRIVPLAGTPYEMGRQHGRALRGEVRDCVRDVLGYFRAHLKVPLVRTWVANVWLDTAWRQAARFVPRDVQEELRGLAEASGVPLRDLYRLHAVPDRTYSCANLAAWGRATAGGRLIHLRNLDWHIGAGVHRHAVVFVVRPAGRRPYLNIGWAGFVGVLSGINASQISVGQIGAETTDAAFAGEPMVFVLRRVLAEAQTLQEAEAIVLTAQRTVGINYIIGDAKAPRAVAIETTRSLARVFRAADPAEMDVPYARPISDAVFRADTAVDPLIRDRQFASNGDPRRPGLEDPRGSSAYDVRYLGQAAGLMARYGALDAAGAQALAREVAPDSNVQSVVYAWPDVWVANARGRTPAARRTYRRLDARALLTAEGERATPRGP
jgi:hypothetical protein